MSMRGISSCQTWTDGGHGNSAHVIGSMADPFTGIIYLTTGGKYNEYGTKMIRRCVVRFVVNEKTKKPFIMLERMYPALDQSTKDTFISFLKERSSNKLDVVYQPDAGYNTQGFYVPMAKIIKDLDPAFHPYRDSHIIYKADVNDHYGVMKEKSQTIIQRIVNMVATKALVAAKAIKLADMPVKKSIDPSWKVLRAMRGSEYYNDCSYGVHAALIGLAGRIIEEVDMKKYKDTDSYIAAVLDHLSNDIDKKIETEISSFYKRTPSAKAAGTAEASMFELFSVRAKEKIMAEIEKERAKLGPTVIDRCKIPEAPDPALDAIPIYVKLLN